LYFLSILLYALNVRYVPYALLAITVVACFFVQIFGLSLLLYYFLITLRFL